MARVNKEYREDAKERIVTTAIDIVIQKGWDAMTLDAIAQNIGVTTPALYSYFKNRDALQDEVVLRALQKNQTEIEATLSREGNIRQILQDYANLLYNQKSQYAQILSNMPLRFLEDPVQREKIAMLYSDGSRIIRDCLARAQSRGEIPDYVDPDKTTRFILSITFGLQISSRFIGRTDVNKEKDLWLEVVERILFIGPGLGSGSKVLR